MEASNQQSSAENFELRSDQVQDLLSEAPSSLLIYSNLITGVLVILACVLTWFVKYPNVITGDALVTSEMPPIKVYSNSAGQIEQILVENGATVQEGQTIIRLAGPVTQSDLLSLKKYLGGVSAFLEQPANDQIMSAAPVILLTEAQAYYNSLVNGIANFKAYQSQNANSTGLRLLRDKVIEYEQILKISQEERDLLVYEIETARKQFEMQKKEFELGYISEADYLKSDMARVQAEIRLKAIDKSMIQNKLTLNDFKRQLNESIESRGDEQRSLLQSIKSAHAILQTQVAEWEALYTIKAPISGIISFPEQLSSKQFLSASSQVFTVIPNDKNIIVDAQVAAGGIGKVSPGQLAKLKFDIYPHATFGYVEGEVMAISPISDDGKYNISIALKDGLTSNYGNQLEYRPEMKARLEILTEDVRLFQRIFGSLIRLK